MMSMIAGTRFPIMFIVHSCNMYFSGYVVMMWLTKAFVGSERKRKISFFLASLEAQFCSMSKRSEIAISLPLFWPIFCGSTLFALNNFFLVNLE